jgi:formate dehydrogenase subunit gamma
MHAGPAAPWNAEIAEARIAAHMHREGPLLPILHDLQGVFGRIPREAEPLIATKLNITRAEVHGVVTFYHDFRNVPAGVHTLRLCRAEACQSAGGEALAARAEAALGIKHGETTADGKVTLEAVYCLGLCSVAPSAMIDERVVGRMEAGKLDAILDGARACARASSFRATPPRSRSAPTRWRRGLLTPGGGAASSS